MATGREARAERLNERLRGAHRANVGDESFNLDIADFGSMSAPPSTSPQQQQQEQHSSPAKRRRLDNSPAGSSPRNPRRSSVRRSPRTIDPYDLPSTPNEWTRPAHAASSRTRVYGKERHADRRDSARFQTEQSATLATAQPDPDELESLPAPSSARSATRNPAVGTIVEEIGESPEYAPGSGRRTSVRAGSARSSSVRLQDAMQSERNTPMSSSPLTRKSRRSEAAASARSTLRTPIQPETDDVDELSPAGLAAPEPSVHDVSATTEDAEARANEGQVEEEGDEGEEAQTIEETEAARSLGMKRPRREPSPQLGSNDSADMAQPRRKRGRPSKSPAVQRQGARKPATATGKRGTKQPRAKGQQTGSRAAARRPRGDDDSATIELTVQRFVNHHNRRGGDEDDDDADPLQLDIPFANRTEESAVDVFAQVCDEVIVNTLEQFQNALAEATDSARKKELRIKIRAVEAYREVLNSRLLQHAIHLNHWHSLRKRIRYAQREKLALREEIIRLKGEREQVALRMDAVRAKHEADTKDSTFLLNTSSTMRDIDLAVSQGRGAPELSAKAQKEAELANLELAVAQVSDQASSASRTGGLLNQIKDFNAFLERAAEALETR